MGRASRFSSFHSIEIEEDVCYIQLPESTHTFLHTEPLNSFPFVFSLGIATLSVVCLMLVLVNSLSSGGPGNWLDVPVGVGKGVRGAQYCGILVGLLMEEEIPQGLILLRSISKTSFLTSHPSLSYNRFVLSCIFRIMMGYLFLLNLFVIIVQASDVITIFFDILALEFVLKLDDVAYELARKYMLGKRMLDAASKHYKVLKSDAYAEVNRGENSEVANSTLEVGARRERSRMNCLCRRSILLKCVYFLNLLTLFAGVVVINHKQNKGDYWCSSITVMFGDTAWRNGLVKNQTDPSQTIQKTIIYSYFNGIYLLNGTHDGYPRYTEQNKMDGSEYQQTIPAEIKYCKDEERWIFTHDLIMQSDDDESECSWLFQSPKTREFSIVDVPSGWSMWTGIVGAADSLFSIQCNECELPSDCNYHGEVSDDGLCECFEGYYGTHCDFETPCTYLEDDEAPAGIELEGIEWAWSRNETGQRFMLYGSPVYNWIPAYSLYAFLSSDVFDPLTENEIQFAEANYTFTISLTFSGSRWLANLGYLDNHNHLTGLHSYDAEYHAFWADLFEQRTYYVSEPTSGKSIVGVDFYRIVSGTQGNDRYGPFGLLTAEDRMEGYGYFYCHDEGSGNEIPEGWE